MKYDKIIIGKQIKKALKECKTEDGKKLTQEGLAEKLQYKRETVNSWANGRDLPSLDVLLRMCDNDIFDCELGYLLGEHNEKTRTATNIVEETNFTPEAVQKLQEYKISANKRESFPFSKYLYPDEFIPALLSFMLESDDFNRLVSRICSQNRKTVEYAKMSDVEREIISEAYKAAQNSLSSEALTDISKMRDQYQKEVKNYMIKNRDEIKERFPLDMVEGFYENIFIPNMQRTFDLARLSSEDVFEMNNFLTQRDLYDIVKAYVKPVTNFR